MAKLVTVAILLGLSGPVFAQDIVVTGHGTAFAAPDQVELSIGVTHEGRSASEVLSAVSSDLAAILGELRALGIPEDAIKTTQARLDLRQDYNSSGSSPRIIGFIGASTLSVTSGDVDEIGALMDTVVKAGATNIRGLRFEVSDPAPHLDAARVAAVRDGAHKAGIYAEASGFALGALVELVEGGAITAPMQFEVATARSGGVPIAPGQVEFSASVTMRYGAE